MDIEIPKEVDNDEGNLQFELRDCLYKILIRRCSGLATSLCPQIRRSGSIYD